MTAKNIQITVLGLQICLTPEQVDKLRQEGSLFIHYCPAELAEMDELLVQGDLTPGYDLQDKWAGVDFDNLLAQEDTLLIQIQKCNWIGVTSNGHSCHSYSPWSDNVGQLTEALGLVKKYFA